MKATKQTPPGKYKSERQELAAKGRDQRDLSERYGKRVGVAFAIHPETRRTGRQGASNVGEDESSGSE
jgi:hypothetical protein